MHANNINFEYQQRTLFDNELTEANAGHIEAEKITHTKIFPIKRILEQDKKTDLWDNILMHRSYKTCLINNRRYLGNKYKLLPFITAVVKEKCPDVKTVADIFSGTGAVSSAFLDTKVIISNDLMYSNYISNFAWFAAEDYNKETIIEYVRKYNTDFFSNTSNYVSENFANTFFSEKDCLRIGAIREDIEVNFSNGLINKRERAILITSLLYAMDKIAKTCGHYDAYIKGAEFDKNLELLVPMAKTKNNKDNRCYNEDANELVKTLSPDLVYIDPPYNSRQYCDAYHLLENIARWEKPKVYGVARKMDRSKMKSRYCTLDATTAFADLIKNISAKYILLSYNNMSNKGNDRSNAKITDDSIIDILTEKQGSAPIIFSETYKAFTAGKSDIAGNEERLFLCKCKSA